jgi:dipeptidase
VCDTLVAPGEGGWWLAKNSDREPGEAQEVEHLAAAEHPAGARLSTSTVEIDQAPRTLELVISRPFWMWGAEMGVNAAGVAIGNEAVFTKMPFDDRGVTGMDLVRLGLERAHGAEEALEVITALLETHGQGGRCGYRSRTFRYHSSFLIADPREAWVLETAGRIWAAQRVKGPRSISNGLTIGQDFDRIAPRAVEAAIDLGTCRSARDFDFARCFGRSDLTWLTGAKVRRGITEGAICAGPIDVGSLAALLSSHAGHQAHQGLVMRMPCAHAAPLPTRAAGQTTGSMIAKLEAGRPKVWLTGTSAPCLSVFKPVCLGSGRVLDPGPAPGAGYDPESLFWRHERLHRRALFDLEAAQRILDPLRAPLGPRALELGADPSAAQELWDHHRASIVSWTAALAGLRPSAPRAFAWYWRRQSALDGVPAS